VGKAYWAGYERGEQSLPEVVRPRGISMTCRETVERKLDRSVAL